MRRFWVAWPAGFLPAVLFIVCTIGFAQRAFAQDSNEKDSGLNLSLHANSHASAADIGLPAYPGAFPYKVGGERGNKDNDSSLDMGLVLGDFHLSVVVAGYETGDSPEQVLKFYRKALSHYGEVLECDHGNPIGKLTMTDTGLTCSSDHDGGGHVQVNGSGNSANDHELRAGSPHKYRVAGIDDVTAGKTHFALVYLELPKDTDKKAQ